MRSANAIFKCCLNSALPGGKHQAPSKFCTVHQDNEAAEGVNVPAEFSMAKLEAGLIPEDCMADDSEKGCKKDETTAALIRPCDTSESYTRVFLFILQTFYNEINDFEELKYLGYDRACRSICAD